MKTRPHKAASVHRAAYRKASDTGVAIPRKNARPVLPAGVFLCMSAAMAP